MIEPVHVIMSTSKNLTSEIITNDLKIGFFNPNNITVKCEAKCTLKSIDSTFEDTFTYAGYIGSKNTAFVIRSIRMVYDIPNLILRVDSITTSVEVEFEQTTVSEMCENTSEFRLNGTSVLPKSPSLVYLKAFCNMPGDTLDKVYVTWERSLDGVNWELCEFDNDVAESFENFSDIDTTASAGFDLDSGSENDTPIYKHYVGYQLVAHSPLDFISKRADVYRIDSPTDRALYKVTLRHLREIKDSDAESLKVKIPDTDSTVNFTSKCILGSALYTPIFSNQPEFLVSDISNVSQSKAFYSGKVLYNFGNSDFKNALIASYTGETVRPISRATFLDSLGDAHVTCITPWKEYLIAFTNLSAHLITPVSGGFISNTVNSFIGVSDEDYRCATATLNGIIFKSGSKVYMLYPNVYSGNNSILNLTDISEPVSSILEEYGETCALTPFAFSTDSEYILMLPQESSTVCLRYNFSDKYWTFYTYPVQMYDFKIKSSTDIRVFGKYDDGKFEYVNEYLLDAERTLEDVYGENIPYTDYLRPNTGSIGTIEGYQGYVDAKCVLPIPFEYDSGQKSDTVNITKQYVESKLNFATLHPKDAFPIRLTVHIDGTPHPIVQDISTDSAFWKRDASDLNVLGKPLMLNSSDIFNTFRQMFVRYSGKGRSIRHIIEGESLYAFKMYDILCRYRNLNIKQ